MTLRIDSGMARLGLRTIRPLMVWMLMMMKDSRTKISEGLNDEMKIEVDKRRDSSGSFLRCSSVLEENDEVMKLKMKKV